MSKKSKKFYAVRKGMKTGIFDTWEECKQYVTGFKSPEYKSFASYDEALSFINQTQESEKNIDSLNDDEIIAYVDGSYNIKTKAYGYGVVLITTKSQKHLNGKSDNQAYIEHRNVAGEIYGSVKAIEYAIENNFNKIYIHFDYMGIKSWALGEWKTNKELTKKYKSYIDSVKDKIEIMFVKVKAHSENKNNDIADLLAKKAVGIQ